MTAGESKRERKAARLMLCRSQQPRFVVMVIIALAAIVGLAMPMATSSAQLVWNVTASAPAGLYWVAHEPWAKGERVAVLPGEALSADLDRRGVLAKGRLLIKRVAAVTGDRVCRQGANVSINGEFAAQARDVDSQGMPLGAWQGCVALDDAHVFLLGDTPGSYDGRYFGVTPKAEIIGQAMLLYRFEL